MPSDRTKHEFALDELLALYDEGEVDSAFERLNEMLDAQPENAELILLKAEWSLEEARNPGFVGTAAAGYVGQPHRSGREQAVIDGGLAWAERALTEARQELNAREVGDTMRAFETAALVAPWEARIFLAKALIILDALPGDTQAAPSPQPLTDLRSLFGKRPSETSRPHLFNGSVTTRLRTDAESALKRARDLAVPGDRVWREATHQLAALVESTGKYDDALCLLEEAARLGEEVSEQVAIVEGRMLEKTVTTAVLRARQLIRLEENDSASALIEAVLVAAPRSRTVWMLLADWFALHRNDPAAISIYRWLLSGPPAGAADQPLGVKLLHLNEQVSKINVQCKRCGRNLPPSAARCPLCSQPLHDHLLLEDRFDVTRLTQAQEAALGLVEALIRTDNLAEAVSRIQSLRRELDRKDPITAQLETWLKDIKPRAEARAYDGALAEAIRLARQGEVEQAREALRKLDGQGDDRPAAWLALTLGAEHSITPAASVLIRRAARIGLDVWATTPSVQRQRLVNVLLAAGRLAEARALLKTLFTDSDCRTKKVQALIERTERLTEARIGEMLSEARLALEAGRTDEAFGPIEGALAIQPEHTAALLLRGQLYLRTDAPYSAASDFRTVLDLNRQGETTDEAAVSASLGLARTYEALRDLPEAVKILEALPAHLPEVAALRAHFDRQRQGRPAVRVVEVKDGVSLDNLKRNEETTPVYTATFAVAVRSVARYYEGDRLTLPRREIVHAGHEFIATLGGLARTAGNPAFELRYIAEPDADTPARGRLTLAILCRVTHRIAEGAEHLALEIWDRLRSHLPVAEHYIYQYEPVYDEAELERLIEPFDIRDAAEIVRREAWEEDAYAVQPFTTGGTSLENLAWILLRQAEPCMVAIHLEPTSVLGSEVSEFRKNLDRLRRMRLPDDDDNSAEAPFDDMRRTVFLPDGQRGTLVQMAGDLNASIQKRAYLMRVTVASAEPHASMLSHHVASEICGPGGRYDVIHAREPAMLNIVKRNLARLDAERWLPGTAPRRLARLRYLVSEMEAGWTFRLPLPGMEGIAGIEQIAVKAAPPTLMPAEGTMLGESVSTVAGVPTIVRARQADRRRHTYVIGKTGVGKSTLLEAMALQDIEAGRGVAFLDPHGDSIELILGRIPAHRMDDVIVFDPSDEERPIGLNFLEAETDSQRHRITTEFIQMLMRMYDPHQQGIVGPRFQHNVRNAMLTAMQAIPGATLIELVRVLTDSQYVREILPNVKDPVVRNYWEKQIANTSDFHKSEILDYIVSKFNRFVGDVRVRAIVGQSKSSLNFRQIMDERKILLVNLSKGKIGPESAEFLGFLLLQSLLIAALSRADQSREERDDYCLYVDEFQTFATESFSAMLSEGRKYGICLVMANQYLAQLPGDLREAVFGNVGSLVAFGVGSDDARRLESQFYPVFGMDDLLNLPKYTAAVRLLVDGVQARPFAMRTRLVKRIPDPAQAALIREVSRQQYGRHIDDVTEEINARFKMAA